MHLDFEKRLIKQNKLYRITMPDHVLQMPLKADAQKKWNEIEKVYNSIYHELIMSFPELISLYNETALRLSYKSYINHKVNAKQTNIFTQFTRFTLNILNRTDYDKHNSIINILHSFLNACDDLLLIVDVYRDPYTNKKIKFLYGRFSAMFLKINNVYEI